MKYLVLIDRAGCFLYFVFHHDVSVMHQCVTRAHLFYTGMQDPRPELYLVPG